MKPHERTCIVCRKKKDKIFLKRIVRSKFGEFFLDLTGKMNGRGAYVCSVQCMQACKKNKALNRAFKCAVTDETYEKLLKEFVDFEG